MTIDKRFQKTDQLLMMSLVELLQEKSFEKITINDLCNQAIVGRSTFYHHFDDKYALLDKLINDYTAKFQSLIDQREPKITSDNFLIYLYEELFQDRSTWLTLLSIKNIDNNLEFQLKEILKKASQNLLTNIDSSLPEDFLTELYAINALNAISWTLKNGHSKEIAAFMNHSLKQILY